MRFIAGHLQPDQEHLAYLSLDAVRYACAQVLGNLQVVVSCQHVHAGQTPPPLNIAVMVTGVFAFLFYLSGQTYQHGQLGSC